MAASQVSKRITRMLLSNALFQEWKQEVKWANSLEDN